MYATSSTHSLIFNGASSLIKVILDIGEKHAKLGICGEECPRVVVPTEFVHRDYTCEAELRVCLSPFYNKTRLSVDCNDWYQVLMPYLRSLFQIAILNPSSVAVSLLYDEGWTVQFREAIARALVALGVTWLQFRVNKDLPLYITPAAVSSSNIHSWATAASGATVIDLSYSHCRIHMLAHGHTLPSIAVAGGTHAMGTALRRLLLSLPLPAPASHRSDPASIPCMSTSAPFLAGARLSQTDLENSLQECRDKPEPEHSTASAATATPLAHAALMELWAEAPTAAQTAVAVPLAVPRPLDSAAAASLAALGEAVHALLEPVEGPEEHDEPHSTPQLSTACLAACARIGYILQCLRARALGQPLPVMVARVALHAFAAVAVAVHTAPVAWPAGLPWRGLSVTVQAPDAGTALTAVLQAVCAHLWLVEVLSDAVLDAALAQVAAQLTPRPPKDASAVRDTLQRAHAASCDCAQTRGDDSGQLRSLRSRLCEHAGITRAADALYVLPGVCHVHVTATTPFSLALRLSVRAGDYLHAASFALGACSPPAEPLPDVAAPAFPHALVQRLTHTSTPPLPLLQSPAPVATALLDGWLQAGADARPSLANVVLCGGGARHAWLAQLLTHDLAVHARAHFGLLRGSLGALRALVAAHLQLPEDTPPAARVSAAQSCVLDTEEPDTPPPVANPAPLSLGAHGTVLLAPTVPPLSGAAAATIALPRCPTTDTCPAAFVPPFAGSPLFPRQCTQVPADIHTHADAAAPVAVAANAHHVLAPTVLAMRITTPACAPEIAAWVGASLAVSVEEGVGREGAFQRVYTAMTREKLLALYR